ncbi:MAG: hypothetical protein ACJ708_03650 [Nitrososphaeraceae archaeon]
MALPFGEVDDRLAIDLLKGQDRAKPDPSSPYADGVSYILYKLLKHALTLLIRIHLHRLYCGQYHRLFDKRH